MPLVSRGQGKRPAALRRQRCQHSAAGDWDGQRVEPGGSPLPVRDVDNPARQPFQVSILTGNFTVPAGKRLVIEFVSGLVVTPPTCRLRNLILMTSISIQGQQVIANHRFVPTLTASGISNDNLISQETRLYADPGTTVRVIPNFSVQFCDAIGGFSVTGYLVDVP